MKSINTMRIFATLMIALSLQLAAAGQSTPRSIARAIPPVPCHDNTKLCIQRMRSQLSSLRAYVSRLRPGDKVEFNPQPDPPGSPDPWYRRAVQAFRSLQEEFADLSKYPSGPCKVGKCQDAIKNAQAKFGGVSQATNASSANAALAAMKPCIDQLSRVLIKE